MNTNINISANGRCFVILPPGKDRRSEQQRPYLIFVSNAGNAVSVKFLAECKKNPEKNEKITVLVSIYIITVIT